MTENTKIEWCHHTFNPWVGCTAISPACAHCYAEGWAKRTGQAHLWTGERRRTGAANWGEPLKWNRKALAFGDRPRVFCASLADVFDNQVPEIWRSDLFELVEQTTALDWMFLTKRPQNIPKMLWPKWDAGLPAHIWVGTTIEDRKRLVNADHLRAVPAAIRFLSIEPLLEDLGAINLEGIHLVIVGGESGRGARPMNPAWVRPIREQCSAAGVAFFFKQQGDWGFCDGWEAWSSEPEPRLHHWPDGGSSALVGKKAAGRLLDGIEHNGMPSR